MRTATPGSKKLETFWTSLLQGGGGAADEMARGRGLLLESITHAHYYFLIIIDDIAWVLPTRPTAVIKAGRLADLAQS